MQQNSKRRAARLVEASKTHEAKLKPAGVLDVGCDKVGDETDSEAGPGCRSKRLLAKHLGRDLGTDNPRESSPRGSKSGNPCELENQSAANERGTASTKDEQMKQAAMRLARDPVGVEL